MLTLVLPVWVLSALSVCSTPEPASRTLRLIELVAKAEVTWPEGVGERPQAVSPVTLVSETEARRVARVAMLDAGGGRDERAALLGPVGSRYRFSLRLPRDAALRTALGYAAGESTAEPRLRFRIAVEMPPARPEVVLDREVAFGGSAGWQDVRLSLERWSGREITLELVVQSRGEDLHWGAWWAPEIVGATREAEGFDVVLISLDTLRADHLGCYGYARPTSPNLDAFAAGSVRFATAVSQSPWTRPAHRALLTGVYPVSRGGRVAEPLASVLWRAGYRTLALTGGGQLDGRFGFSRGFEAFRIGDWLRRPEWAVEWLESQGGRRRFLFLHTYEIHDPYDDDRFAAGLPSGRLGSGFAKRDWQRLRDSRLSEEEQRYVVALYDGDIAFADERLGELFAALTERGLLERAIVVVTSDHGEQFFEHGSWGHGQTVYDHQLLVPLILHLPPALREELAGDGDDAPSLVGRVVEQQVSLVDLYPTLLDLLGIASERATHGRSLRPLLEGGRLPERAAFTENTNIRRFERKSLRTPSYKLVHSYPRTPTGTQAQERVELYDLRADPAERRNLAGELVEIERVLDGELRTIVEGADGRDPEEGAPEELDSDLRRQLEALGYLDG